MHAGRIHDYLDFQNLSAGICGAGGGVTPPLQASPADSRGLTKAVKDLSTGLHRPPRPAITHRHLPVTAEVKGNSCLRKLKLQSHKV